MEIDNVIKELREKGEDFNNELIRELRKHSRFTMMHGFIQAFIPIIIVFLASYIFEAVSGLRILIGSYGIIYLLMIWYFYRKLKRGE